MSQTNTGSYDMFAAISQSGLNRLVQSSFLEEWAIYGLPAEYNTNQMNALLGLPEVSLLKTTTVYKTTDNPLTVTNVMTISFPFINTDFNLGSNNMLNCLNGTLILVIPLIKNGSFNFSTDNLFVSLAFSENDPDPNMNQLTSNEKVDQAEGLINFILALFGREPIDLHFQFEKSLTDIFRTNPPSGLTALVDKMSMDNLFNGSTCQTSVGSGPQPATDPVIVTPTEFACVGAEIQESFISPTAEPTNVLLFKIKLSARSVALGTDNDTPVGDTSWIRSDDDMGILISNRFLQNEIIMPKLICGLLENVADCTDINQVRNFFAYPRTLIAPIPFPLALPTINNIFTTTPPQNPNAFITRFSVWIPQGDSSPVRISMQIEGGETGYNFTATINLDLIFSHRLGKLELCLNPDDPIVDVNFEPWVYGLAIALGLISPLIGGALLAAISVFMLDIIIDPWAATIAKGVDLPDVNVDMDSLLGSLVLNRVILDDLYIGGNFRITHNLGAYCAEDDAFCEVDNTQSKYDKRICKCAPILTEQKSVEFEEHLEFVPDSLPRVIKFGELDVATLTSNELQPINGTRFVDLEQKLQFESDNISQSDLRHTDLTYSTSNIDHTHADITLYVPNILIPDDSGYINKLDTINPLEFQVAPIGVLTEAGQYGCIIVWHDINGIIHVLLRAYRQLVPGLHLIMVKPPSSEQDPIDIPYIKSLIYAGLIKAEYYAPQINRKFISSMSEQIGLPRGTSVNVGSTDFDRQFDGIAVATAVLIGAPIISWAIIRTDGSEVMISPNGPMDINVAVDGDSSLVTFKVDGVRNELCRVTSRFGEDIDFILEASVNECSKESARFPIVMEGRKIEVFGYDHWLEEFEKQRAVILGDIDDGGPYPDPIRNIILGDDVDRMSLYLDSSDHFNRKINTIRDGMTSEEFLRLSATTDGKRGIEVGDVVQVSSSQLLGNGRPFYPQRTLPAELGSESANAYLQQSVSDTFEIFRTRYGDSNRLRMHEKEAQESLSALPNAGDLLRQIPPRRMPTK